MGGKRIKVFRSRKLFIAVAFTVFFVAVVNEARFLITLGCSMILLLRRKYRCVERFRTDEKLAWTRTELPFRSLLPRAMVSYNRKCANTRAHCRPRFHCFPLNYNCWIMPRGFLYTRVRVYTGQCKL